MGPVSMLFIILINAGYQLITGHFSGCGSGRAFGRVCVCVSGR